MIHACSNLCCDISRGQDSCVELFLRSKLAQWRVGLHFAAYEKTAVRLRHTFNMPTPNDEFAVQPIATVPTAGLKRKALEVLG